MRGAEGLHPLDQICTASAGIFPTLLCNDSAAATARLHSLSPPFFSLSLSLIRLTWRSGCERHTVSVLVTGLHGDVHQSVRVSVSWAKPYRVCQRECLSVCVLVSVSLIAKAGARPERMKAKESVSYHACTRTVCSEEASFKHETVKKGLVYGHGAGDAQTHPALLHMLHHTV